MMAGALLASLSTGCSTDKTNAQPASYKVAPPKTIYVSDFYIDPSQIKKQSLLPAQGPLQRQGPLRSQLKQLRGDDPESKARKLVRTLSDSVVKSLNEAGLHAEPLHGQAEFRSEFVPAGADLPKEGWVLGGWFTKVDEGNRAMQATVGFEMGAEEIETQVVVADLSKDLHQPFLFMGSGTGPHHMPGGLITKNPYAMAAKYVMSRGATERDVKKQGKAIAQDLIHYLQTGQPSGQPSK